MDKIPFQAALHDSVRNFSYFANSTGFGSFWQARDWATFGFQVTNSNTATMSLNLKYAANGLTLRVPVTWSFTSSSSSALVVCQAPSSSGTENSIIITSSAPGTYVLTFKVATSAPSSLQNTCLNNSLAAKLTSNAGINSGSIITVSVFLL